MGRTSLLKTLETTVTRSAKHGLSFGVILFSIDRFKLANSRFGHARADVVLRRVAQTAKTTLGRRGKIGRWGGDEFLCIVPNADIASSDKIAEELREAIEGIAIPIDSGIINITASFGVACYPHDGDQLKYLLVAADEALHQAKLTGRNRVVSANSLQHHVFKMGSTLETALREDRIMPAYQPIVDLHTGAVVAEEALARIITMDGEAIAAEEFIEVASHFQLTHKIDRTIILSAFSRCANNLNATAPITHFINISGDLLRHPDVLKDLLNSAKIFHLGNNGSLQANSLVIEVTERELLSNLETARRTLTPFLELGLRLALDDFGSGYSSLQYLADLPISFLKIDGGLVTRIDEPKVRAIIRGVQNIATELNLITLAECVENESQAEILRAIGVRWAQGHHYGKAVLNEEEADIRREMSVNWAQGYYYQKSPQ